MKNTEFTSLTDEELANRIVSEQEMLQKLNFAHAISPVENPMKVRQTRRLIARLKTEQRSRTLGLQK